MNSLFIIYYLFTARPVIWPDLVRVSFVIYDYIYIYVLLICYKCVTTQNLAFLSYWYRKKRLQMQFEQL
jgi:hypothetical protein